ncbi:MarR family transcriptional regulator [Lachnospiraceae bacterium MD1]|jgi:DNA-binding MarR family transcriptional regulator|uniref:MarR family transcriptional regulator n=1 Tax=Variimorphobacter saccharofermentans TaxID=2755051 RepID=A0A839K3A7_9FIRM|nr:MarR family transcriptional regulator [Variimorphobacter saccharofermentans]MBB2183847.1 MarR family transcriptional regulator [Variimorphobacter saccharofermentans]
MDHNTKHLHEALIGCYTAHKRYCVQQFQKLNLTTGQPKVLYILLNNEGYLQKELAQRCHVEPATMTSLLNNMIKKGLIYKNIVYVSGGKRAYAIYLTKDGYDMALKIKKIIEEVEEISYQDFNDKDKQLLMDLLNRIQTNLEKK